MKCPGLIKLRKCEEYSNHGNGDMGKIAICSGKKLSGLGIFILRASYSHFAVSALNILYYYTARQS